MTDLTSAQLRALAATEFDFHDGIQMAAHRYEQMERTFLLASAHTRRAFAAVGVTPTDADLKAVAMAFIAPEKTQMFEEPSERLYQLIRKIALERRPELATTPEGET